MRSQRLTGSEMESPVDVVRWLGAVQSQDYPAAKWGVGVRASGSTDALVEAAFNRGDILRTHAMRPTWHFIARDDLRWILQLTSARVHVMNNSMYRRAEVEGAVYRRAIKLITERLRDGNYATRAEIADALEARRIPARAQRLAYFVMRAELDGIICSGPMRGKQHTYALLDARVPPAATLDRDEALAKLAERYFASHGPATVYDFSWWSGLTVAEARRAITMVEAGFANAELDGKRYWWRDTGELPRQRAAVVHLLPNYDEHVVAYRDHGPSLDPAAPNALDGWGTALVGHLVLRNGLVVGGWRRVSDGGGVVARMQIVANLSAGERGALHRAVRRFGDFVERPVHVVW